jgi:hypothetical protein
MPHNSTLKQVVTAVAATASISILVGAVSQSAALAESFIQNGNKALNTNNNFVKLDGNPRMAVWKWDSSDADQQFDRLSGALGGTLLKHRSTGKCLNSHYLKNGGLLNVWACNPSDPDQNFNIISVGNGYNLIQRRGTNLCVDSPTRDDGGTVYVQPCDANNANQKWNNGTVAPPTTGGPYYRNFEGFINAFVGQWGIARLDRSDLRGQCVTLIARYLQEVYLTGTDRTRTLYLNNGGGTAQAVASQFGAYFQPTTNQGLPVRGAVVSFPQLAGGLGHTAIVMASRTLSNGQRQIRIMDSNGDNKAPNTQVKEYYSTWINIPNGSAQRYGNNIYWTNPR